MCHSGNLRPDAVATRIKEDMELTKAGTLIGNHIYKKNCRNRREEFRTIQDPKSIIYIYMKKSPEDLRNEPRQNEALRTTYSSL